MSLVGLVNENAETLIFLMGRFELLKKVIEALNFKGGESSLSSIKIATMLEEEEIAAGLHSGKILKLIEEEDGVFIINNLGEKWLSETKGDRQLIIAEKILAIDPYRDIIYRTIASEGKFLKVDEIAKAFYLILSNTREEIRNRIMDAFIDFGTYSNLIEAIDDKANPRITITSQGEKLFESYRQRQKARRRGKGKKGSLESATIMLKSNGNSLSCHSCGKSIMPDYILCPYCGINQKRSCNNCGKDLQPEWKMCPFCGT